jgi:hypothetical protein
VKRDNAYTVIIGLMLAALFISSFNMYTLSNLEMSAQMSATTTTGSVQTALAQSPSDVTPKGEPRIYGKELGVAYDHVHASNPKLADATINKLAKLDVDIQLTEDQKARYINILYKMDNGISCEYCCGARAIIFENGEPACGCAHSYAMRGVAKYLITEHGSEFTDAQILEEAAKWKTLFFPTQSAAKAEILKAQGIEPNYINIGSNKYRGIEQGAGSGGGGMVGGC